MSYIHDKEKAEKVAKQTLDRMRKEGLIPVPDNYALWYAYFSNDNPEIKRAIDILISSQQSMSEERCQELFQRFLSDAREEETIRRAGEQIQTTIQTMSGTVKDVRTATSEYSGNLANVSQKLKSTKDPKELEKLLTVAATDTEKMVAYNKKLEEQLDQSSAMMLELQRDLEMVRREALTDGLTGLSNRKAFDTEIRRIIRESEESGKAFSLLMMDIDHFKPFNDSYGHQVGDQVLRLVARTMIDSVKGRDVAARYGGEEFAVILPETNMHAAMIVAEALRKAIANKEVINRNSGDKLGQITMSIGAAEHYSGEPVEDLIERADAALYTAKHNGRNQVASAPTPEHKSSGKKAG